MELRQIASYEVRVLRKEQLAEIYALCLENDQYYKYAADGLSKEGILEDFEALPPNTKLSQKHFVGLYKQDMLVGIIDLIDGYPTEKTSYLGFIMLSKRIQGQGEGTKIVRELMKLLKEQGYEEIQLGIDKDNPQSTSFWFKQGFEVIREVNQGGHLILAAKHAL